MRKNGEVWMSLVLSFLAFYVLQQNFHGFKYWIFRWVPNEVVSFLMANLIIGLPLFLSVLWIHGPKKMIAALGLDRSALFGFLFALICTMPMLVGYASFFPMDTQLSVTKIFTGAIIAGFIEELLFRGILFGQIFRYTKLGFIISVSFGAVLFALAHLYQSQDTMAMVGVFLTTFLGSVVFAWVYAELEYNLWSVIFLHLFMNLFWMMFAVSDNAFGGVVANLFRMATIVLTVILVLKVKKWKGKPLEVNKNSLFNKISQ